MKAIRCGLLPGESRAVVERLNEPLRAYLMRCLGMPVELIIGSNYVATGEALRRGELDLAYLGPVTYILQSRNAGLEPFARPTHGGSAGPTFKAAIIVPVDSAVENLGQLRGCEIAMGDLVSTSGSWVPRYMLLEAGLSLEQDYVRRSLGAHDEVAAAVVSRTVAAGGLSLPILQRLLNEGRIDGEAIRILAESQPIPEYMWTFREGLSLDLRESLRQAFVNLNDLATLGVYRATAFIPAVDADVDRVRYWMENILQARLQPSGSEQGQARVDFRSATTENTDKGGIVLPWRKSGSRARTSS
ncbi:phosphate/phosphite/phosphonate ABC transporter substrate-binding protein [Azomonas macrocytogenes]|uniref:Phosphonate transport system substrate-binding protein n=1 Tax=Azomonas macrocytogenes TaxID=69962 RepID=A0A839T8H7_AZOMA|nr:phosphate/phosphite/phosphonate ABC transporter substrate-binding protein [Azomonas macrocytogenes]MBB3104544.1 phosphonate transport system substrate-binding protein [Azomonas macrocytogenes]